MEKKITADMDTM